MRLLVDTNVIIDALQDRHPFAESAQKLLVLGRIKEFDLWMSISQLTDAFYVLTDGGKPSKARGAKQRLLHVLEGVRICSLSEDDGKAALCSTWSDFEVACVYQAALKIKADAIITRNKKDFERSSIRVFDCDEFFVFLKEEKGLAYEEISFSSLR